MRILRPLSLQVLLLTIYVSACIPNSVAGESKVSSNHETGLSIDLQHFSAEAIYGGILLKWKTISERANSYFIVERSVDGSAFQALTEIDGAGNADYSVSYSFQDNDLVSINQGSVYYRLKQVDFSGSENTSKEAQIKLNTGLNDFNVQSDFIVETGISSSKIKIELSGLPAFEMIFVQFIDQSGNVAAESAFLTDDTGLYADALNLPIQLAKGNYTVVGSSPAIVIHKQLIVN